MMAYNGLTGAERIAKERQRQILEEGFGAAVDNEHHPGDLAAAGRSYALHAWWQLDRAGARLCGWSKDSLEEIILETEWPWSEEWWKPSDDPVRNLEKAGALIAAEIDRLLRLSVPK